VADASGSLVDRTVRRLHRPLAIKFSKYTVGSVVALATSELTLVLVYGTGWLGTTAASVVAFLAGALPNYVLNRSWVWGRRGRVRIGREVFLYALVSAVSLVAAAAATGAAAGMAPKGSTLGVALVATAYLATYGILFVLKFVVYEGVVFR
jgi:putative flippase GtrA